MRKGRRVLVVFLTLSLVIGLCPGLAFAVSQEEDEGLQAQSSEAPTPNPASDFTYEVGDYVVVGANSIPGTYQYRLVSDVRIGSPKDYADEYYTSDKWASNKFNFGTRVEGFDYFVEGYDCGHGVYITEYNGDSDTVVIPNEIDGIPVVFAGVTTHDRDWTKLQYKVDASLCRQLQTLLTCAPLHSVEIGDNDSLMGFYLSGYEGQRNLDTDPYGLYNISNLDFSGCPNLEEFVLAGGADGSGRVGYVSLAGLKKLKAPTAYFALIESLDLRYMTITDDLWDWFDTGDIHASKNMYMYGANMTQNTRNRVLEYVEDNKDNPYYNEFAIHWGDDVGVNERLVDISASTYFLGDGHGLTMRFDASHDKLSTVFVDGKTLSKSAYSTRPGSTVVELPEATLASLGAGSHELTALYRDGGISTASFEVNPGITDPDVQLMYRLYNPNSGEHFYTASVEERDHLDSVGWDYEGHAWTAPRSSATPVYRLYSGTDHHYTTSAYERDELVRVGWSYEGVGWYSDDAKGIGLHRLFNPNVDPNAARNNSGSHHYTTSEVERDHLVSIGWRYEDYGWYGVR